MDQAYDEKNNTDYEHVTELLNEGLNQIINNDKLKVTTKQLSEITGIHRNTISNRIWPAQRLENIRVTRRAKAVKEKEKKSSPPEDPIKVLQGKLDNAKLELIHWFNEFSDMEKSFEQTDKRFRQMRDARDKYRSLYKEERAIRLEAEAERDRYKDLIDDLE